MAETGGRAQSYAGAIHEALHLALEHDPSVFIIGEGVPDPKAIFGTTAGLRERFGPQRVLDMPLSENGVTGICIGSALMGMRPVLIHQRIDFALLSLDQLFNNAAKWRYMFAGQANVPLVVRVIIGRGWGQGPQHSQSLQALFAHIAGLKVVMPAVARDAKGLLLAAIADPDPVIFIEHRWLHSIEDEVPEGYYEAPIGAGRILRVGGDLTIAAFSYMTMEALRAANALAEFGIDVEVIDMRSVRPLDAELVARSVTRTGRLLVADTGPVFAGIGAELAVAVTETVFHRLKAPPTRVGMPPHPVPTSRYLANETYPEASDIARAAAAMLALDEGSCSALDALCRRKEPRDAPDNTFRGPF